MHLCCVGIMKRLLSRWKGSKKTETKCHLTSELKSLLEGKLAIYASHVPSEFKRKLNSGFHNFKFWKATEFRQFFLFAGISVLHNILPAQLYLNFLYFSISMRILLAENQEANMTHVSNMLKRFIKGVREFYGDYFVSYNVHSLVHLPDDYLTFGSLEKVSCFPFENDLGVYVKGRLTGHYKPLQQICRHVSSENLRLPCEDSSPKDR